MADLNRIDAAGTVEICDGISQSAAVKTTTPGAADGGLVVREAARGQGIMTTSIPVVIASDQSAVPVSGTVTANDGQTITDNNAFTDGTSKVFMSGHVFDDVAGTALTENDAAASRIDSKRAQICVIEDATTRGQKAGVAISLPSSSAAGLVVRDAAQGQQTMANSRPVVLASDQTPIPITVSATGTSSDGTGRLRTSNLYRIFQYDFSQGDNGVFWDTTTATGGTSTFVTNQNAMSLNTTTSSGSEVVRQTKQRFFNQTGLTHTYVFGALLNASKTNLRQRVGCFDEQDGVYFEQSSSTLHVVQRTFASGSAVNTSVAQASWNIDRLDGTGTSGITLDFTKINTYLIEYSWVGTGRVRLGVLINGAPTYCHEFLNDNALITPNISRSTLPVRLELTNTAATASISTMKYYGVGVFSDSGQDPVGMTRSVANSVVGTAISNVAFTPVLSVRLKTANIRSVIRLLNVSIAQTSTAVTLWRIILNGTLTSPTWTDVTGTNTLTQTDIVASAVTGGDILFSGNYVGGSGGYTNIDLKNPINLSSNIAGTADIITLACQRVGAVTTVFSSMTYMELS